MQKSHLVVGCPLPGYVVDHIDSNPNNNHASNLQIITQQQNLQKRRLAKNSTTGIKGVCFVKRTGRWQATIGVNGMNKYLGTFDTLEEAAQVRRAKAVELFGKFANEQPSGPCGCSGVGACYTHR